MRVLLSTIGSRGEVQPVVALALRLTALGHEARVCASPDFRDWIEDLGISAVPLGWEVRPTAARDSPVRRSLSSPEGRRRLAWDTVAAQFATLPAAASGCDVLVGCGALQVGARSVAELCGIEYVNVHYCPATLPSLRHAPAPWPGWPPNQANDNRELWELDAKRWRDTWGPALNAHRAAAGLAPVRDLRGHVLTDRPWLAADPTLGPWPGPNHPIVVQTGAWILPDERPLPPELAAFLDAGEPAVYFGLGSMAAPGEDVGEVIVAAARALGRRVIVSRGWADLPSPDDGTDHISIGEANHQALFGRVAAVVHHGGAGTTTTVARAGTPHVVIPQAYDQHYWARRVERLGIGVTHRGRVPTVDSLVAALGRALEPGVAARAKAVATAIRTDGTRTAARALIAAHQGVRGERNVSV